MKIIKIIVVSLVIILLFCFKAGYKFSRESALEWKVKKQIDILSVHSLTSPYYKDHDVMIFKSIEDNTMGMAYLQSLFDSGLLWKCQMPYTFKIQGQEPFVYRGTCGGAREYFFIVYTEDPNIKYIAVKGDKKDYEDKGIVTDLNFIMEHQDTFMIKKIKDNHVVFYGENNKKNRARDFEFVRAFGENGELIAFRGAASGPNYINNNPINSYIMSKMYHTGRSE